jgi:hypothetical protein
MPYVPFALLSITVRCNRLFGMGTDFLELICDQHPTFRAERSLAVLAFDTAA